MFVDSHCHLDFFIEDKRVKEVVKAALKANVTTLQTICTDFSELPALRGFAETYEHVFFSVGVHPHEAKTIAHLTKEEIKAELKKHLSHPKALGLGETGLDYYYNQSPQEAQENSFRAHIEVSQETGIPLIIHTRDAEEDTLRILEEYGQHRGVIHCFTGTQHLADETMKMGFDISFSGIVTFKNATSIQETCKTIPLERLLIETDAPFLAPAPKRGQKNEPMNVVHVAEKVAELKETPIEEVAKVTSQNFFRVFNKASPC